MWKYIVTWTADGRRWFATSKLAADWTRADIANWLRWYHNALDWTIEEAFDEDATV